MSELNQFHATIMGQGTSHLTPNSYPGSNGLMPAWNTDGTFNSWKTATTPAGSGTEIQHRDGSNFGAVQGSSVFNGGIALVGQSMTATPLSLTAHVQQTTPILKLTQGQTTASSCNFISCTSFGGSEGDKFKVTKEGATTLAGRLTSNDPFIRIVDSNAADLIDTGFYSKYVDGSAATRFTGLFRDVTDGKYKLFTNHLVEPTTTVSISGDYTPATLSLGRLETDQLNANSLVIFAIQATYFLGPEGNGLIFQHYPSDQIRLFASDGDVETTYGVVNLSGIKLASSCAFGWTSNATSGEDAYNVAFGFDSSGVIKIYDGVTSSNYRDLKLRSLVSTTVTAGVIGVTVTGSANQSVSLVKLTNGSTPGANANFIECNSSGGSGGDLLKITSIGGITASGTVSAPSLLATNGIYLNTNNSSAMIWFGTGFSPAICRTDSNTLQINNGAVDQFRDLKLRGLDATGTMKFGTHSAIAAETVTGYITITDAGGTTRKLAVVS